MVRDPGRARSGQPPSQGGQPDRQERHRTHRTGAGEVRTTPSTVGGCRPPTYRVGSSGGGSSEDERPRVSSGAASGGSGQTSIPVSVPASRPSTFAPATAGRGSGLSGEGPSRPTLCPLDASQMFEAGADVAAFTRTQMRSGWSVYVNGWVFCNLAIATRLAAKYGPVSVQYQNAERRVEIRREKNVMVTNPFGHQGFAGFRARFKKAFGMYPLPKHTAFARAYGIKRVFQFMENGRDIPESEEAGPSNAEAGEDGAADDDFAAAAGAGAGAAAAAGTGDGVNDDDLSDFSEGLSGVELEEDELGLSPQQEQRAESGGDDEDDTPIVSASQRLARLVVGAPQPPAPSTVVPAPLAPRTLVPAPPAPRTVVPRPSVRGTVVPSASIARTDAPQPSAAQIPASAQGTEGRKKKSKKSRT
ncbi:hypothetical protein R1sor_027319 [Riccia sorocarpa]|uniref:Coat protein n=1 Tax=Riccia sorocarpa TaxID=122646 RepID=A0ABD3GFJ3_9MARC